MEIKLHVPELAIVNFKVESAGLGKALATGIMLTLYKSLLKDLNKWSQLLPPPLQKQGDLQIQ